MFELAGQLTHNHQRHTSTNPHKTAYSYRSSVRHGDEADIIQQFSGKHNNYAGMSREKEHHTIGIESLEKTKNDFELFIM